MKLFVPLGLCLIAMATVMAIGPADEPADEPVSAGKLTKSEPAHLIEPPITEGDREHWAWQPIIRPSLPQVRQSSWPSTGVDYFILAELESAQLAPADPASKSTLLRRIKFDLLGLPPSVDELNRFEQDRLPDAYERLVDRMLAEPAYGERWSQHWLDLARFAETDGFEHDKLRKDAWRYRDWVIQALNQDMPYDQFIRLQLTGDTTGNANDEIATMFCLAGPDMPDLNEQGLRRHDKLNEITSTVGASLLAMQMHCAQCHDHKYDPISQADFYRLRAVFESAIPNMRRDEQVHYLASQTDIGAPRLYFRGELGQPGPTLSPGFPRVAVGAQQPFTCNSETPRQDLANWLFAPENPLTSRVIANRIWQHHFGHGLTENSSDFGVIAGEPTHPELLDWLASELQQGNWSLKQLHRNILLSATYRQSSVDDRNSERWQAKIAADPHNDYYSRFPRKRLEGEAIRDAILFVSGQLNREQSGESVRPPLPQELVETLLKGQWTTSENAADQVRRSIYVFARRNLRYPIFDAFDRPDAGATCARRDRSTTAIQSLSLLNSDLTFVAAQAIAERLIASHDPHAPKATRRMTEQLFMQLVGRTPAETEYAEIEALLSAGGPDQMRPNLLAVCVALINTNEFIYVD